MEGDSAASGPFEASNWEVFKDSFAPQHTRRRLKPWERAPTTARAPRIKGHKIWKKASSRSHENKENEVDPDIELQKEGNGSRKRMRVIGGKENISDAPWLVEKREEEALGLKVSPKKNARLELVGGDTDALLVPRKRTNTNHLVTPRKPLQKIASNSIIRGDGEVTVSVSIGSRSPLLYTEPSRKRESGALSRSAEKPTRRRKSMRKSVRRQTLAGLSTDIAPVQPIDNPLPEKCLSPIKVFTQEKVSHDAFDFECASDVASQDLEETSTSAVIVETKSPNPLNVAEGREENEQSKPAKDEVTPEKRSPKKRVTFAKTTMSSSATHSPTVLKPAISSTEGDEDGDEAANQQLENELRAHTPSKPSRDNYKQSSHPSSSFRPANAIKLSNLPVSASPNKRLQIEHQPQADPTSEQLLAVSSREQSGGETFEQALMHTPSKSFEDATLSSHPNTLSIPIMFTPPAGSAVHSRNMSPVRVEWNAQLDPVSPTKTSRTPKRTRKTPQRGGVRRSPRTAQLIETNPDDARTQNLEVPCAPAISEAHEAPSFVRSCDHDDNAIKDLTPQLEGEKHPTSSNNGNTYQNTTGSAETPKSAPETFPNGPASFPPNMGAASSIPIFENEPISTFSKSSQKTGQFDEQMPDVAVFSDPEIQEISADAEDSLDADLPEHPADNGEHVQEPVDIFHNQDSGPPSDLSDMESPNSTTSLDRPSVRILESSLTEDQLQSDAAKGQDDPMTDESEIDDLEELEPISFSLSHTALPGTSSISDNLRSGLIQGTVTTEDCMEYGETTHDHTRPSSFGHEDADVLRNFLNRAKANKAAKCGPSSIPKRKRSLPHSPLRLPLASMDANSSPPSSPKNKEEDVEVSFQVESPPKRRKREHLPTEEPSSVRRSGRNTKLPIKSQIPAPTFIPVRRLGQEGESTITLKRSEEKQLATITRVNTRKNKGSALWPAEYLALKAEEMEDPAARHQALKEAFDEKAHKKKQKKKGKTVVWAEELAQFQTAEEARALAEKAPEKEKDKPKEIPKEVHMVAFAEEKKTPVKVKVNMRSKMPLGMAGNGTPGPKNKRKTRGHT